MWSDNETTVDYLNFGIVADACTNLLQQAKGQPISIGVSGGWGAGKTSLVRMIEARLKKEVQAKNNNYVFVTFNPWLYQDFDSARSAILQLVGDELLRLSKNNETLFEKAKGIIKRVNLLRLAQLGGETAATLATGLPIGSIGKAIFSAKDFFNSEIHESAPIDVKGLTNDITGLIKPAQPVSLPSEIHAFRNALEELLTDLEVTLVVFVDDLDRCLPKTAIATLESIHLLLFLKRSAFIIAADNEFIRNAVQVHFENFKISDEVKTNYFDKLIQVPLHVPRLGVNEAKAYLALLLMERAQQDNHLSLKQFAHALEAIPERLQRSWRGDSITTEFLQELVGPENTTVAKLMELAEGLAPLLTQSSAVKANPRLMKRFLNTVYLRSALAKPQGITLDIPALAKWHLVERCDEDLANKLATQVNSASDGRVEVLRLAELAVVKGEENIDLPYKDEHFVREWLQLEPRLGETDLRPLLHLSRDTVARDFGLDELTNEGRALRDALIAATKGNASLSRAIREVGAWQTELAMVRAWQLKAAKRTWRKREDIILLIEPCKIYPNLANKAEKLLSEAPVDQIGPGVIPLLYSCQWARTLIEKWESSSEIDKQTKKAIQEEKKGSK